MNFSTFTPNAAQTKDLLDHLRRNPLDADAWIAALRGASDWRDLVDAIGGGFQVKQAALIAATKLSDEGDDA